MYIYIYIARHPLLQKVKIFVGICMSSTNATKPPQSVDFTGSVGCVGESVFSLEVTRYIHIYIYIGIYGFSNDYFHGR